MYIRLRDLISYTRNLSRSFTVGGTSRHLKWFTGGAAVTISGLAYYCNEKWDQAELSPEHFTKYRISYNDRIDSDHFMLELTPLESQKVDLWTAMRSEKLWSVQIKQPECMVVRNYTPLPLEHVGNGRIQRFSKGSYEEGKLFFYLKRYHTGEVARWLSELPEGHVIELRGPYIDHELPKQSNDKKSSYDIATFTAGTGIAPIAQILLTNTPFAGRILMLHSCSTRQDLGPLKPLLEEALSNKRGVLHYFESANGRDIRKIPNEVMALIPKPHTERESETSISPILSLVCGPDGYLATMTGAKHGLLQGPVLGLLAQKNWDSSNVFKLS
ncbi:LAME_0D02212g1_1 [Lachancea meyersii CBS 8951]|uniref:LAME_0D02212g1_1 n=1 Tax=Lachancea meyersii CBS 8951 TaxID=1266667 RepID=A0A1G4J7J9_9SACH|nr:LAME_0D02212g1_1 [Lachancea meyersii CBS 8951]